MKYLIKQFFEPESSTYSYFVINKSTKETIIIDPVIETFDRDLEIIKELGLKISYVFDTHVHADHITAANKLRELTNAKTVIGSGAKVKCADILIDDNQIIKLGDLEVHAISTPGHTDSCTSYYIPKLNVIFTGDALLIRGTGRTDFQQGSAEKLYESIQKIFALPKDTIIYPAHDYKGRTSSTIEEESNYNPRLAGKTKEDFIHIMNNLKLPNPKKIDDSLPANLNCGQKNESLIDSLIEDSFIKKISNDILNEKAILIDVRELDEYNEGHLNKSVHIPLNNLSTQFSFLKELQKNNKEIFLYCRSGNRSGQAENILLENGIKSLNIGGYDQLRRMGF